MKKTLLILSLLAIGTFVSAAQFEGSIVEWKKEKETFKKPEETFKKALHILKNNYVDKNISEEDLYRAATEGMLASLNTGKESWNTLLSPDEMTDKNIELSGKLVGIGATLDWDKNTLNSKILGLLPGSAAEKAGLKKFDQILSVDGKRYKDLKDMVMDIRGNAGSTVKLKVLREDRIMEFKITRALVKIPMSTSSLIDDQTGYLQIDHFTTDAAKDAGLKLSAFKNKKIKKLILDLRSNPGGLFQEGLEVADLFLKDGDIITKTVARDGTVKGFKATGSAWSPETQIIILTSEETASSAELLTAAISENRKTVLIGAKTAGKWSIETLEKLPNDYFIKYSTLAFQSPTGKSYAGVGIKPHFEVNMPPEENGIGNDFPQELPKRLEVDPALKAAIELPVI